MSVLRKMLIPMVSEFPVGPTLELLLRVSSCFSCPVVAMVLNLGDSDPVRLPDCEATETRSLRPCNSGQSQQCSHKRERQQPSVVSIITAGACFHSKQGICLIKVLLSFNKGAHDGTLETLLS